MPSVFLALIFLTASGVAVFAEDLALSLAVQAARQIQGDEDFAAVHQLRVTDLLIEQQRWDEADALASAIPGYRRCIAAMHCAAALSASDCEKHDARIAACLALVDKQMARFSTTERDAIRLKLALYQALQDGGEAKALATSDLIVDKESKLGVRLFVAARKAETTGVIALGDLAQEIADVTKKSPFPEALEAARELARLSFHSSQHSAALLDAALSTAKLSNVLTPDLLFEWSETLLKNKQVAKADDMYLIASQQASSLADVIESKATLYPIWARLAKALGHGDKVQPMLERAVASASKVEPMYQPGLLGFSAAAWRAHGAEARATVLLDEALKIAGQNPNPRMRLRAALELCYAHLAAGVPIDAALAARLKALIATP